MPSPVWFPVHIPLRAPNPDCLRCRPQSLWTVPHSLASNQHLPCLPAIWDYQSPQTHFHDVVKVKQHASAADKLHVASAPAPTADDLISLSLGSDGYSRPKGAHQRSLSSSSSGTETDPDDQLSLGLSSRCSTDGDDRHTARPSATPLESQL
ncbi:hypothetical protein ZWY2020_019562 [Hordeum vulgare]|nr:hypothetical protein ZWY2020_019562 [Hordeum vulgare]